MNKSSSLASGLDIHDLFIPTSYRVFILLLTANTVTQITSQLFSCPVLNNLQTTLNECILLYIFRSLQQFQNRNQIT